MLISDKKLVEALADIHARNRLIAELEGPRSYFRCNVLAAFLGSNLALNYLVAGTDRQELALDFAYHGYTCFLFLDRGLSLIPDKHSLAYKQLRRLRLNMLRYFNEHALDILGNPREMFFQFRLMVDKLGEELLPDDPYYQILEFTKQKCHNHIVFQMRDARSSMSVCAADINSLESAPQLKQRSYLGLISSIAVTEAAHRHAFYLPFKENQVDEYNVHKVLIPTRDGMLLDGLVAKKKHHKSRRIVLGMVGHFQSEDKYLGVEGVVNLSKLFASDVVIINHRNYASRAARFAESMHDLTQDVLAFDQYYRQRYKQIILYGMCGGAPIMILTAAELSKQNLQYKLIVDRAFQRFNNFFDLESINLLYQFESPKKHLPIYQRKAEAVRLGMQWFLVQTGTMLMHGTDYAGSFSDVLSTLPENDVMVLSGRSREVDGRAQPANIDAYVPPKNDMRQALHDRCEMHKERLRQMIDACSKVLAYQYKVHWLDAVFDVFLDMRRFLQSCIELIENENLKYNNQGGTTIDIHTYKLYVLKTRHDLPLTNFFHGFFNRDVGYGCSVVKKINKINAMREQPNVLLFLWEINAERAMPKHVESGLVAMFTDVCNFMKLLNMNSHYIAYMARRIKHSGVGDFEKILDQFAAMHKEANQRNRGDFHKYSMVSS